MINLKNIQVTRGARQIFNDYNLTLISPGLNIIEGKNGSGKTTLIKVIAGFLKPNKGEITSKPDFTSHEWAQSHIYISSNNSLSNELSVLENIKAWPTLFGVGTRHHYCQLKKDFLMKEILFVIMFLKK